MSDRLLQRHREVTEAFNRRDWQAMRKHYAPHMRWEALPTGTGTTVEGVDALLDFFDAFVRDSMPDLKFTFQHGVASGDTTVVEVRGGEGERSRSGAPDGRPDVRFSPRRVRGCLPGLAQSRRWQEQPPGWRS